MKPILNLTIRRKWLDMIASGEKREEYRAVTNAQVGRLYTRACSEELPPAYILLRAGYRMDSWTIAVRLVGMTIRGAREIKHPDWGEARGVARYVLKLGEVFEIGDYASVKRRADLDSEAVPPVVRAADKLAQAVFDGLLGRCGDVRYWRPGDPADAEARQNWIRLVAYADRRDDFIAAQREARP